MGKLKSIESNGSQTVAALPLIKLARLGTVPIVGIILNQANGDMFDETG